MSFMVVIFIVFIILPFLFSGRCFPQRSLELLLLLLLFFFFAFFFQPSYLRRNNDTYHSDSNSSKEQQPISVRTCMYMYVSTFFFFFYWTPHRSWQYMRKSVFSLLMSSSLKVLFSSFFFLLPLFCFASSFSWTEKCVNMGWTELLCIYIYI